MKVIAKPRKPMMLILGIGEVLEDYRPSVVSYSDYLQTFVVRGQVEILAQDLSEEASDAEFLQFWLDSDRKDELAIESFAEKYFVKTEKEEE